MLRNCFDFPHIQFRVIEKGRSNFGGNRVGLWDEEWRDRAGFKCYNVLKWGGVKSCAVKAVNSVNRGENIDVLEYKILIIKWSSIDEMPYWKRTEIVLSSIADLTGFILR